MTEVDDELMLDKLILDTFKEIKEKVLTEMRNNEKKQELTGLDEKDKEDLDPLGKEVRKTIMANR
jgi:hypothetical protein